MTSSEQYRFLVESLRLLAAPPAEQLRVLPNFVLASDEIVSTFGDAFLLVPQLERASVITRRAADSIREIDVWMDSMPSDGSLANASTLATHFFWTQARVLAARALQELGEEVCSPSLGQSTWVKAAK